MHHYPKIENKHSNWKTILMKSSFKLGFLNFQDSKAPKKQVFMSAFSKAYIKPQVFCRCQ